MRIRAWGPLFALITLFAAGLIGLTLQHSKPQNQAEPTQSEQRNGPTAKAIIQSAPDKGDKKGKDEKGWTDPLLILFNGLLTLFTWLLYRATQGLFIETAGLREAAAEQSRDMKASIATAAEANRISVEGFHASQRAWVTEETIPDSGLAWNTEGCRITVKTTIKNIGIAPAQDVDIQVKIYVRPTNKPIGIDEVLREPRSHAVGHLLFPSADIGPSKKLLLTREKIDECRQLSGTTDRMDVIINIAVIVRYLATPDKRDGRTVRLYRLQHIPNRDYEDEAVVIPKPVNMDENVSQDRIVLTHHWMPSYAD